MMDQSLYCNWLWLRATDLSTHSYGYKIWQHANVKVSSRWKQASRQIVWHQTDSHLYQAESILSLADACLCPPSDCMSSSSSARLRSSRSLYCSLLTRLTLNQGLPEECAISETQVESVGQWSMNLNHDHAWEINPRKYSTRRHTSSSLNGHTWGLAPHVGLCLRAPEPPAGCGGHERVSVHDVPLC